MTVPGLWRNSFSNNRKRTTELQGDYPSLNSHPALPFMKQKNSTGLRCLQDNHESCETISWRPAPNAERLSGHSWKTGNVFCACRQRPACQHLAPLHNGVKLKCWNLTSSQGVFRAVAGDVWGEHSKLERATTWYSVCQTSKQAGNCDPYGHTPSTTSSKIGTGKFTSNSC